MKVAFALLCSRDIEQVFSLISDNYFSSDDCKIYIHYDLCSSAKDFETLRQLCEDRADIVILNRRVKCAWGEFSLVEATTLLFEAVLCDTEFAADYVYLISESCFPIKPFEELQSFLERNRLDYIELVDPSIKQWAVGGYEMDRLRYRHFFNFRTQRQLFELSGKLQRYFKLERELPSLSIHFGSQWMCLRVETARIVLEALQEPSLKSFLRLSWIPDEFAIHSIVASHVPYSEAARKTLTYIEFDEEGRPLVLYDDHAEHLARQPFFFARKKSTSAKSLMSQAIEKSKKFSVPRSAGDLVASGDYSLFKLASKTRRPAIGGIDDPWWHLLDKIARPYYCVTGPIPRYNRAVLEKISAWGHQSAHGYVFDLDKLDTLPSGTHSYGVDDTQLRNYAPLAFLYDLVTREEKDTIFALDWSDMSEVRNRIVYHDKATLIDVVPREIDDWAKLVYRLSLVDVIAILRQPWWQRRDLLVAKSSSDDFGYWDRVRKDGHYCQFVKADDFEGGVGDGLRAAMREVDFLGLFEPEYHELAASIR